MADDGNGRTLSTAVHVLKALEFIGDNPRGVPVKAISGAVGLSLSSAYSLVNSLRIEGFVSAAPAAPGLYVVGPKLLDLYKSYVESNLQPERMLPFLEELRDRTSTRTYSALWRNGDVEVASIIGRRGARQLRDVSEGYRGAAHALALGKIHLAALPEESWPRYLHTPIFKRFSRNTITTRPQLRHNLAAVRERRLALGLEEYDEGVCCIAAPVQGQSGRLVAALAVSMSVRRFKHQYKSMARAARETAAAASAELDRVLGAALMPASGPAWNPRRE
ncbi:MAG TPA: IclR family transcriptional regulator C-terminal domain-containing protein [Myxococcaceae bacterium]|jgi:DNA-binding IclR family transcriptional regulator|nr:IclR family transcriptional regulator C-terminal domain-containing protein [Myxococcaceae bacterium]